MVEGQHVRKPSHSDYTSSWEPQMAEKIRQQLDQSSSSRPYMVSLTGLLGSGKTISTMVVANHLEQSYGISCFILPHDGYHYPLAHLRTAFADPEDVIYRRGAPETFDADAFLRDLQRIQSGEEVLIALPGFDHAKGDPEPDKHVFDRHRHKVVLCEGMYILHNDDGWQGISGLFDWNIYLDADIEDCMARLAVRNQCIPGYTPEEIVIRVDKVDRVNALLVQQSKDRADIVVKSVVKTILGPVAKQDLTHKKKQESTTGLLTDVELSDLVGNHDWAMDIVSRPGANSFQHHRFHLVGDVPLRDRSDSVATDKSEPPEPVGKFVGTWEKDMATRIRQLAREKGQAPFMVALVAGPGTGKTVSAMLLADHLEKASLPCMIMPHDGYHYPLDYLKTFPNPQDVIYRRGAPDTFDPHALVRDLARIREGDEDVVKVPAFDHARADPEPDAHIFYRHIHKIVICEGLYLLHPSDGWEDVHAMFDLRIYMNANVDTCIERVKIRNQCIPGYTAEEIAERSELVDRVNFITVQNSKIRADVCVESMC